MGTRAVLRLGPILLVGLFAALVHVGTTSSPNPSLRALCKGRNVKLRTINHLNTLVKQLDTAGEECSPLIKEALNAMKQLTDKSEAGVCTLEKAEGVINFVEMYLKNPPEATRIKLPKPLERFAIAYGMKTSGICGRKMLSEFAHNADRRLKAEFGSKKDLTSREGKQLRVYPDWRRDFFQFEQLLLDQSPLGMVLRPIVKPGELILPVDLMQAIPGMAEHIQPFVPESLGLRKMKLICERVYRPLYEATLLPLAKLTQAGFINREFYWQKKYRDRSDLWSRAVFICETVKMIELNPESKAEIGEGTEAQIVADWNKAIKGLEGDDADEETRGELATVAMVDLEANETGDKILGRFDFSMKSLVKAFDANKDHIQLLRERILKRSFRVFRRMFQIRGFSVLLQRMKVSEENSNEQLQLSDAELEKVKFEWVKSELISLANSPRHNSMAYNVLVKWPNVIRRLISGIIFTCLVIMPLILGEKMFGNHRDQKDKLAAAVDFSYNWLHD